MNRTRVSPRGWAIYGILAAGLMLAALPMGSALAQDAGQGGYALQESQTQPDNSVVNPDQSNSGPVRMARFAYISGEVTWRGDGDMDWADAKTNLPLKQGAQISVGGGGRAEIQFDDGSYLRLGSGAMATLITLYSDTEGEFTEIKLTSGLGMLRLNNDPAVYQMDTPLVSVKSTGPSEIRLGVNDGVEVGVLDGQAVVEGAQGKVTMHAADYLDLRDENSPYNLSNLPGPDSWQRWNEDRDRLLDQAADSAQRHDLPNSIALVAGDLDSYGTWYQDPSYGEAWCPRVLDAGWRPYCYGSWVWVNPFGWTWCSSEPWGWAPYHYGTWFYGHHGWAWCPGPAHQYWCPAVVHFSECRGEVAWCPLAPTEVRYPATLGIGFRGGDWTAFFSIGVAGCYYPSYSRAGVFVGHAWNNVYVNHVNYINRFNTADRLHGPAEFVTNHNTYLENRNYIPVNARSVGGATEASQSAFAGREGYRPLPAGVTTPFAEGHTVAAPAAGQPPVVGPPTVHPSLSTLTPTRTFVRSASDTPRSNSLPVYRSPVNSEIARTSSSFRSGAGNASSGPGTGTGSNTNATHSLSQSRNSSGSANSGSATPGRTNSGVAQSGNNRVLNGPDANGTSRSPAADAAARARASLGWNPNTRTYDPGTPGARANGSPFGGSTSGRSYGNSGYGGRTNGSGYSGGSPYGGQSGSRSYDNGSSNGRSNGGSYPGRSYDGGNTGGRNYGGGSSPYGGGGTPSGGSRYNGGGSAPGSGNSPGTGRPASGGSPSGGPAAGGGHPAGGSSPASGGGGSNSSGGGSTHSGSGSH